MFQFPLDTQPKSHETCITMRHLINLNEIEHSVFTPRQVTSVVWIDHVKLKNIQTTPIKLDGFFSAKLDSSTITHGFSLDGYSYVHPTDKSYIARLKVILAPYISINCFSEARLCRSG